MANPVALFDAGFQLSFMAVLGIAIIYSPLSSYWKPQLRPLRWAWELTCVSLAAQLFTLPLVLYYFGRVSPYFLLSNFVVIPATTGLLYLAIVLLVSTPIHGLQLTVYHLMLQIAQGMTASMRGIVQLPGAQLPAIYTTLSQTFLLYGALCTRWRMVQVASQARRCRPAGLTSHNRILKQPFIGSFLYLCTCNL